MEINNLISKPMVKNISIKVGTFFLITSLLLVWFLTSCSSTPEESSFSQYSNDDWDTVVNKTISDKDRAVGVKELGYQLIELTNNMDKEIGKLKVEAMALSENYNTSEKGMENLLDKFTEIRNRDFVKIRDIIFAMRTNVNEDEWEELTN